MRLARHVVNVSAMFWTVLEQIAERADDSVAERKLLKRFFERIRRQTRGNLPKHALDTYKFLKSPFDE